MYTDHFTTLGFFKLSLNSGEIAMPYCTIKLFFLNFTIFVTGFNCFT